ncbi:TonB family protein [Candidatus Palauibacter sp.]|uniref:TonB family protein n=1 Tax=Candidatus Palauibacter sp. TaxID=3101350 RepID=UPI003B010806
MVIAWIGYCLLISGLLALAALASERALGHFRKPVRWAWFAAIVGSVTVPVVAFFAPGFLPGFGVSPAEPAVGLSGVAVVAAAGEVPAAAGGGFDAAAVGPVLAWGWVLLVVAMVGYVGRVYGRLRSEMRTWRPGRVAGSRVMISEERGPAVVGFRRSVVVMPKWIPELEDRLLRLVFLHEREHQRAGDHRLFAAAVTALVLMPWNLFVWWQVSRLRLAIEFDCDHRVLRRGESPRDYADALITVGSRVSGSLLAAAAFAERKPAVERRLRRMTEPLASMRLLRTLGASGVAMVAVLFVLGCPGPESGMNAPEPPAAAVTPPSEVVEWTPPLRPSEDALTRGDQPSFIAYDRAPVLQNAGEVSEALVQAYPTNLKDAGIGGRVEMWLYLDTSGTVRNTEVKTTSGNSDLDAAAADVVATMRFEPAMNRDQPTDVWVAQWITFQMAGQQDGDSPQAREPLTLRDILVNSQPVDGEEDLWLHPTVRQSLDPLIIIDGVIQSEGASLVDVNALDIDHVEIIKGPRAVELYGERASNGVIEITTKDGTTDNKDNEGEHLIADVDQDGAPDVFVRTTMDGEAPLIVVDGVIQSEGTGLADLRALDIDHVEVIKGERAIELYGERASNGVVTITTKDGAGAGGE